MPDLRETQERLREARGARDEARAAVQRDAAALRELDAAIAAAERTRDADQIVPALRRRREEAERRLRERHAALREARDREREIAASVHALEPQRLIEQMDDRVPFLLLPLRIETKFASRSELLVRIFPDDIAVAAHEKTLAAVEATAGQQYWMARARANGKPTAEARANAHRQAWSVLATRHGPYRAGWIAHATRPANWADALTDPTVLDFPAIETKPATWSEAPRSFVLPDRFVVVLVSGTQQESFPCQPIPDDLVLGPDPLQVEGLLTRDPDTGRITVDEDLRWLVDFERAVAVGMALRIPLAPPWVDGPIETLIVLGVRGSAGTQHTGELLARLIESHRYSEGIALVPQGAPTNNTDDAASGFTTSSAAIDAAFEQARDAEALVASDDPFVRSDGERLAVALGLSLDAVQPLAGASRTDVAEAIAMNRALWPATMGGYLHDMITPLVSDATIEHAKRFFVRFVTGRGMLPALRVGSQPYGVLTTSALGRWLWADAELGEIAAFWGQLLAHLGTLDGAWRRDLLPHVSYVGRPPDLSKPADAFATLLAVIGQQASSVEYYSRKAVSDDYLANYIRLEGAPADTWNELKYRKHLNLGVIGLGFTEPYKLRTLTFWREHDRLAGPVVDGDPVVPLSESDVIRPYDGTHNYIHWLTLATRAQLQAQAFTGADGKAVAPPAALLYQMLRHAYLSELGRGGIQFAKLRAAAFAELPAEPAIANVGVAKSLLLNDVMNLDVAKVGVTTRSETVADYLLTAARAATRPVEKPPEAVALSDMTAALKLLAALPTARLERLFAEHVDLCSYRLDAWIQGLFSRRLELLREGRQSRHGVHLGAFGWVENLRPSPERRRRVEPEEVPAALREDLNVPVVEYRNSGGYVHAPSLAHAMTAAVLRNGYISHAEPEQASTMAVNLSSSRVRTALEYLEGLRRGQDLAALLGYQLERGLHERHPGLELDEFIYVLRERFPLTAKKLTPVPDGQSAEVIEARNVINGYDLLDFVRAKPYPYGIGGLPADPGAATSRAIGAEIDRLADAMDALIDLFLAESVHQVVQGNYDRARGVLQAVTEGDAPPEMEVVQTPRGGRALTHRVAISLAPGQTAGWHPSLTVRAAANAPLNHWLATVLPPPADIQWTGRRGQQAPELVGLDALGLEPLDVVLMCAESFGTLTNQLERFLVQDYRRTRAVPDQMRAFFGTKTDPAVPDDQALVFDLGSAEPNRVALASLGPLLDALHRLVVRGRPVHANDFVRPAEAQSIEPADPRRFDLVELKSRIEAAYAALETARDDLAAYLTSAVDAPYAALAQDHLVVAAVWTPILGQLQARLTEICRAGLPDALPAGGLDVIETVIDALVVQARSTVKLLTQRLAAAREALDIVFTAPLPAQAGDVARELARRRDAQLDSYSEAAKLLLGRSFVVVPHYTLHPASLPELAVALGVPIVSERLVLEEWLQPLTRLRPAMEALGWVLAYHDWLRPAPLALVAMQLPVHAGDAWIGSAYGTKLVDDNVLSVTIVTPQPSAVQGGLLVDEWTEVVPTASETTGLAFQANRPNAQPPQALLLAVAPQLRGAWSWDDLVAIVLETLQRARLRAVEPDMVLGSEYSQVLPALLAEFNNSFVSTHFTAVETLAKTLHATGGT